ncbi:Bug family tripartite tricarboxylate transporter substrate binding protein [Ottowia thiooxydans]|uniref:Tripartite-type tricarboxylate transporter receptor subunit TctC n=1 Tax=Ottowia thiooxydans TaxID=219182 RepID=A0ABV2Q870_9BURK
MSKLQDLTISRRKFSRLLAAAPMAGTSAFAQTSDKYPTKAVRIVVPFAAGGGVDVLARTVGQKLSEQLGAPFLIDNRPGAGTIIGTDVVAKAPADGYSILMAVSTHVTNSFLYQKLPYDPFNDFRTICTLAKPPITLYANAELGLKNISDLINYQKKEKKPVNYGTGGVGTLSHLGAEEFSALSGLPLEHVIYKGGTPALSDTMAGHVPLFFGTVTIGQAAWKVGKVVALGVMADKRQSAMPNVPTFKEQGLNISVSDWYGLLAPKRVPDEVIAILNSKIDGIMNLPDVQERLAGIGIAKSSPQEMQQMLVSESERWGRLIKKLGLKAS